MGRPKMQTLGECLETTANFRPNGYTVITAWNKSFWQTVPPGEPDEASLEMEASTAAIAPVPVTIHILAGTTSATARALLKLAAQWLKQHGALDDMTPIEPAPVDADEQPF